VAGRGKYIKEASNNNDTEKGNDTVDDYDAE